MCEGKFQEIFTQNESKYHQASKYLNNLNRVHSYLHYQSKKARVA